MAVEKIHNRFSCVTEANIPYSWRLMFSSCECN